MHDVKQVGEGGGHFLMLCVKMFLNIFFSVKERGRSKNLQIYGWSGQVSSLFFYVGTR